MVFLGLLFIFFARVLDMGLATIRILMLMRGKSFLAAFIGFFESAIYILALREVILNLDSPVRIGAYALGFAAGNYVGSLVEERMAVGFATVQVISLTCTDAMVDDMRKEGFGVTVIEGCGKEGLHEVLNVLVRRKDLSRLMAIVHKMDSNAFVSVMDTKKIVGGFFARKKDK
jgi:uncharacterized protein YebE (UPF0316 family)